MPSLAEKNTEAITLFWLTMGAGKIFIGFFVDLKIVYCGVARVIFMQAGFAMLEVRKTSLSHDYLHLYDNLVGGGG